MPGDCSLPRGARGRPPPGPVPVPVLAASAAPGNGLGGGWMQAEVPPRLLAAKPRGWVPIPSLLGSTSSPFPGRTQPGGRCQGAPPLRRGRGSLLASPRCGFGDVVTRPAVAQRAHAGTCSPLSPLPKVWDPRLWGAPRSRARGQKGRPGESGGSPEAAGSETSL